MKAVADDAQATLVGCLYRERDVPGREPNVAEKAGVMEDFILADASASPAGTTAAAGKMYKVEKISDDKLRALVGKRVEVVGKIDSDSGDVQRTAAGVEPRPDRNPVSPDKINLPEIQGVSIREVQGGAACPAKPVAK